jgi:hypothetical protein
MGFLKALTNQLKLISTSSLIKLLSPLTTTNLP